jgi:hypothetical protein
MSGKGCQVDNYVRAMRSYPVQRVELFAQTTEGITLQAEKYKETPAGSDLESDRDYLSILAQIEDTLGIV